jgi:hypothetical protein
MTSNGSRESLSSVGRLTVDDLIRLLVGDSEFVPLCLSFFATLAFLFVLEHGIAHVYHPNTDILMRVAHHMLTPVAAAAVKPEPVERLQYLLGVLLTPPFLFLALWRTRAYYWRASEGVRRIFNYAATLLLAEGTIALPIYAYASLQRSEFLYVRPNVIHTAFALYALLIFPTLTALAVLAHRRCVARPARWAIYSVGAYLATVTFLGALFNAETALPWMGHLDPVLYPLAQAQAGKTLLVNCAPLYGLYPHFLQPLFKLVPLTVYHFTAVMAFFLVASLMAQWIYLRSLVANNILVLCGIAAIPVFSYWTLRATYPDPYFQYWPIRTLFPSLLLLFSTLYLRGGATRLVYHSTFLCASLAILWNPDTGSVVFGSWILLLGYRELFRNSLRSVWRPLGRHALTASGWLLLVLGGYAAFARVRSGSWPDLRMSSSYYELFSHYGYYMLPMADLPHVWGLMVGIFVLALAIALRGLICRRDQLFHASLFLLAILGGGLFGYYNGRSHDNCVTFWLYVPILIVMLLVDRVFTMLRSDSAYLRLLPLACLFFFFPASALPSLFAPVNLGWFKRVSVAGITASHNTREGPSSVNIDFIKGLTKPGESIFILVKGCQEGPYYFESATRSALDLPSSIDWFFKRDYEEIDGFLRENKSVKVFTVPGQFSEFTGRLQGYRVAASQPKTGLTLYLPN